MALGAVLVDRARRVTRQPTSTKLEGRTQFVAVEEEWFRCRLEMPSAGQGSGPGSARKRVVKVPTLMFGVRDLKGQPVTVISTDRIEVHSRQHGVLVFEVEGDPEPFRKKRSIIGYQASLKKVEAHDRVAV